MPQNLHVRFLKYIATNHLIANQDKVLLAVSGGVDSMVMLELFKESDFRFAVAHCNFQLRGEESIEDEMMVDKYCRDEGIEFFNMRFDTAGEMERTGESVQLAARRLRYQWFENLCVEHGYTKIAIAHHADDSIETFFINLFRGTGLKGLTGIGIVNGRIIRPLMFATRREIADYAVCGKVPYREDSTNRSTKYLRNKIRLGLIPRIKEINPRFTEVIGANVERLTETQAFIDAAIESIRSQLETAGEGMVKIDPGKIDDRYPVKFVLYELMTKYGFKGEVVESLHRSLQKGITGGEPNKSTGKRFYSKDYYAVIDRSQIVIAPIECGDPCAVTIEAGDVKSYAGNSVYFFARVDVDALETLKSPENIALLDADTIKYPLILRRWREGDALTPLGMNGRKKVSDLLTDCRKSIAEKDRQFVLESGDDIVWVTGVRIDDRYKITDRTETVLKIVKETL